MHTSAKGNHLYCVAANVYKPGRGWKIEMSYVHAKDVVQARLGYCRAHPNRVTHSIIDVALAVGFFHTGFDKSGEIVKDQLSAD